MLPKFRTSRSVSKKNITIENHLPGKVDDVHVQKPTLRIGSRPCTCCRLLLCSNKIVDDGYGSEAAPHHHIVYPDGSRSQSIRTWSPRALAGANNVRGLISQTNCSLLSFLQKFRLPADVRRARLAACLHVAGRTGRLGCYVAANANSTVNSLIIISNETGRPASSDDREPICS